MITKVQGNTLSMVAFFLFYTSKIVKAGCQPGRWLWLRLPYLHGALQAVLGLVELLLAVMRGRKVQQGLGQMGRNRAVHGFTQACGLAAQRFALLGIARF